MRISIIIVTYHSLDLIEDCISSVLKYNDIGKENIEVIIVDNSGNQGYHDISKFIKTKFGDDIVVLENNNNGYGAGNNVGVNYSSGEIIAIMNPDVRLKEPLFKKTLEHFKNKEVSSVGYSQIGGFNFSYFLKPEFFFPVISSLYLRFMNRFHWFVDRQFALSGAFVFFRKEDFLTIGKYDERMFMYFEEPDISNRILKIGKKSVYDSTLQYIHLMDHKDPGNEKLIDFASDSLRIYCEKHNLNLKTIVNRRIAEYKFYNIVFGLLGKKERVTKNNMYIRSLNRLLQQQ